MLIGSPFSPTQPPTSGDQRAGPYLPVATSSRRTKLPSVGAVSIIWRIGRPVLRVSPVAFSSAYLYQYKSKRQEKRDFFNPAEVPFKSGGSEASGVDSAATAVPAETGLVIVTVHQVEEA